jgi:hypothetical protein
MKPLYRLLLSGGLGILAFATALASPTLSNLGLREMEAFANGEAVVVRTSRPYNLLAVVLGISSLSLLGWWFVDQQPQTIAVMTPQTEAEPLPPQTVLVPPTIPAPDKYIDVAGVLANRLRPTLITGNPRIGKGIVVAHAIRHLKRARNIAVWLIQPKYHHLEHAYWEPCDRIFGFMIEDYLDGQGDTDELTQRINDFIREWRKQTTRPILLIFDELSMVKKVLPKWYRDYVIPQISVEMSSGETDSRAFWGVTQSALAEDLGMSGGDRATFDLLAIENAESAEHLESLTRSYRGIEKPEDELIYQQSLSPKKAIWYHSALQEWQPMLGYADFQVSNDSNGSRSTGVNSRTTDRAVRSTAAASQPLDSRSVRSALPITDLLAVQRALLSGMAESEIIKNVLGYKAEKYSEGRILFNQIKLFIEEH